MTINTRISITESPSPYSSLDRMSTEELLTQINNEDKKVPEAVSAIIPLIASLVEQIFLRFEKGGRLFYVGAGTSGRLGILDASEIPPTYGMSHGRVIGIIAGGDKAIRKAVEFAEDDFEQGWNDLKHYKVNKLDTIIGIAASGTTNYVVGAIQKAKVNGILTSCITNNLNTPLATEADLPLEIIVGPEFVTGSTRMKSGTSQKLVLNMISTSLMVKLGKVKGNKMVDMQLNNKKLLNRGIRMLMEELQVKEIEAKGLLDKYGSVRSAILQSKS